MEIRPVSKANYLKFVAFIHDAKRREFFVVIIKLKH